jgi:hypothetical protein
MFDDFKTQWVLCWHNKIKDFCPDYIILIIEGPQNILVDSLSRLYHLPMPFQITEGKKLIEPANISVEEDDEEAFLADCEYSGIIDDDIHTMLECYLNLPEILILFTTY